jgi:hypothetical protein
VPTTIPPAGASIKLGLTAGNVTVGAGICPGIGARGSFALKKAGDPALSICAQLGGSASGSKTLTVVPPSSGPGYLVIGLGDGPAFTYKYEAEKPKPKGCRRASSVGSADALEPPFVVNYYFVIRGVPETGESPTLVETYSGGSGNLTICDAPEARGALASSLDSNVMWHTERHALPGIGEQEVGEKLEFIATAGAYNGRYGAGAKVALNIKVLSSDDKQCPKGSTGRLTLTDAKNGRHVVSMKLCGASHTHLFVKGGDVKGSVEIREKKQGG